MVPFPIYFSFRTTQRLLCISYGVYMGTVYGLYGLWEIGVASRPSAGRLAVRHCVTLWPSIPVTQIQNVYYIDLSFSENAIVCLHVLMLSTWNFLNPKPKAVKSVTIHWKYQTISLIKVRQKQSFYFAAVIPNNHLNHSKLSHWDVLLLSARFITNVPLLLCSVGVQWFSDWRCQTACTVDGPAEEWEVLHPEGGFP